jgi:hypothetical protein
MKLLGSVVHVANRELAGILIGTDVAAVGDAAPAHIDGGHDHHGRRRASAAVRG